RAVLRVGRCQAGLGGPDRHRRGRIDDPVSSVRTVEGEGMVCAAQPEAAAAGVRILDAGGNAVDAAVASALVQGVVDPLMCGIAGFGSMAIFLPNRTHEYIDFHAPAPARATPDMWL